MRIFKLSALALLGLFVIAWTQTVELTGKWVGTLRNQGATFPLAYDLKIDGNKLSGTGLSPDGTFELTSCVVKGNDFSFEMLVGNENIKHTGKFYPAGDSVSLHIFFNGDDLHSTLLREKKSN